MVINGVPATESARTNECYQNRFQNGDLDFDGQSYLPDWPNGSKNFPTTFQYAGPFTVGGHTYPQVQFETDVGGSSNLCDVDTGPAARSRRSAPSSTRSGRSARPPRRPPTAILGGHNTGCVWNFGNDQPKTVADFGKDAQYGTPNVARYGGTIISAPMPNPEFAGRCRI